MFAPQPPPPPSTKKNVRNIDANQLHLKGEPGSYYTPSVTESRTRITMLLKTIRLPSASSLDSSETCWIVRNLQATARLQHACQCGITALQIAAEILATQKENTTTTHPQKFDKQDLEEVLNTAVERGYSKQGEIFNAAHLADLARDHYKVNAQVVHGISPGQIVNFVCSGCPVLIPYNMDKNDSPTTVDTRRTHWGLIKGVALPIQSKQAEEIVKDQQFPTDQCPVFFTPHILSAHTLARLSEIADQVKGVYVIGLQGRSKLEKMWPLHVLLDSNASIFFPHEERRSTGKWVIPETLTDLQCKTVIITPH